jgi:2-polyprenyl-3-methyl-5-hydroxy-6-metoxy-1,4-benzoquinol methylase
MVEAKEVYGVDIDEFALDKAKQRKIKTFKLDLSYDKIPLNNNSVDLVTALELIEHLINPDHMLREVHRVLNSHGQFILSTPNLASYVNRLILLLGYQPYNVEVSIRSFYYLTKAWKINLIPWISWVQRQEPAYLNWFNGLNNVLVIL